MTKRLLAIDEELVLWAERRCGSGLKWSERSYTDNTPQHFLRDILHNAMLSEKAKEQPVDGNYYNSVITIEQQQQLTYLGFKFRKTDATLRSAILWGLEDRGGFNEFYRWISRAKVEDYNAYLITVWKNNK